MTEVIDYQRPKKRVESKEERAKWNKRVVSLTLPPEVVNEINTICAERGIGRSKLVRKLVKIGLPIYKEQPDDDEDEQA